MQTTKTKCELLQALFMALLEFFDKLEDCNDRKCMLDVEWEKFLRMVQRKKQEYEMEREKIVFMCGNELWRLSISINNICHTSYTLIGCHKKCVYELKYAFWV